MKNPPSDKVGDSPEVTQAKARVAHLQKLTELMDGYAKNPSNSNKWRYRMDAYIDSVGHQKQVEEALWWNDQMVLLSASLGTHQDAVAKSIAVKMLDVANERLQTLKKGG